MTDFATILPLMLTGLLRHAEIVGIAVLIGCLVALPAGAVLSRVPKAAEYVLAFAGLLQTIPSLALLALVLPILGIGLVPAVVAMAVYALLPILRNTYAGLRSVSPTVIECARAMGMSEGQILWRIQAPLAAPVIVAGIRLSAVYIVSWAVLASLIGAGGLGTLIFEGLDTYDFALVLAGAVPAALLAVVLGLLFERLKVQVTPKAFLEGRRAA